MTRECPSCKHDGKKRPFCKECRADPERPYWKRIPPKETW